mmetsp:Transcript_4621/g.13078  ORF Transcript_4621/g.13078 Transcript_4621/m.13078 type:complete len:406 (-) Transcript_4621:89-1306(-)
MKSMYCSIAVPFSCRVALEMPSFPLPPLLATLGGRRLPLSLAQGLASQFVLLLLLLLRLFLLRASATATALSLLLRLALRVALVLADLLPLELVGPDLLPGHPVLRPLVLAVVEIGGIGISQHVDVVLCDGPTESTTAAAAASSTAAVIPLLVVVVVLLDMIQRAEIAGALGAPLDGRHDEAVAEAAAGPAVLLALLLEEGGRLGPVLGGRLGLGGGLLGVEQDHVPERRSADSDSAAPHRCRCAGSGGGRCRCWAGGGWRLIGSGSGSGIRRIVFVIFGGRCTLGRIGACIFGMTTTISSITTSTKWAGLVVVVAKIGRRGTPVKDLGIEAHALPGGPHGLLGEALVVVVGIVDEVPIVFGFGGGVGVGVLIRLFDAVGVLVVIREGRPRVHPNASRNLGLGRR